MIELRQCEAELTLKASTPNDGIGRRAHIGRPAGIEVKQPHK
jgi:hypothetical protein